MKSKLLTKELFDKLKQNGLYENVNMDVPPVVKLFTPDANGTWLLRDIVEDNDDTAFGLCDIGLGDPTLGYVSLAELETIRSRLGMGVERDMHFEAKYPLSVYYEAAQECCGITFDPVFLKRIAASLKPE